MASGSTAYGWSPRTAQKTAPTATAEPVIAAPTVTGTALNETKRSPLGVTMTALAANSVPVYYGASGVTTSTGAILPAGATVMVPVDDPSKIYVIAGSASQIVSIAY